MSSSEEKLSGLHLETPERVACLYCGETIDVAGLAPFSQIECPSCHKSFALPVPFGNYVLLDLIAIGGMGAVFKGFDPALKRPIAVKVLQKQFGDNPEFVSQFEREAQMLATLNNPNVVQVYTAGSENGQPYIVMELVNGGRLDLKITDKKPLEESFVIRAALDVVLGLKAAAAAGLAHGDVKPENVLFDRDGHAKVVDFGLARFKGETWQPGVIWGTPYFIAPEVARGKQPNLQADIYSLGCSLYFAFAGKLPFDKSTIEDTVLARFKEKPPALRTVRPDLHPETVSVIERMMEVEVVRRYPNYDSLLQDLAEAQKAASTGPAKMEVPKKKSHAAWWLTSSAVSLVVIGLWFAFARTKAPEHGTPPRVATPTAPNPVEPTPEPQEHVTGLPRAAADDASRYKEWKDGSTGGVGFQPWVLRSGPDAGFFIGSSTKNAGDGDIDAGGQAWGMFAHSNELAAAYRTISGGPLVVGAQRLRIDFDHGLVEKDGPSVGIGVQNAATNNLWEFFFTGGSANYTIRDGKGLTDSGLPFSTDGVFIDFRLASPTTYHARIRAGRLRKEFEGSLITDPDQGVRVVHLWNFDAGIGSEHDTYFNNLAVQNIRQASP